MLRLQPVNTVKESKLSFAILEAGWIGRGKGHETSGKFSSSKFYITFLAHIRLHYKIGLCCARTFGSCCREVFLHSSSSVLFKWMNSHIEIPTLICDNVRRPGLRNLKHIFCKGKLIEQIAIWSTMSIGCIFWAYTGLHSLKRKLEALALTFLNKREAFSPVEASLGCSWLNNHGCGLQS